MAEMIGDFMPLDRPLFARDVAEALAALTRQRWPHNTTGRIAKAWGIDKSTAENLLKGKVSATTITKAIRAEGWGLLLALGEELTGQTHHEWEEQILDRIISEAERDREKVRRLREKSALVRERADRVASTLHREDAQPRQRQAP